MNAKLFNRTKGNKSTQAHRDWVAIVVASFALLLSQCRPLYEYIEKPNLSGNIKSRLLVDHFYGHPSFQAFVEVINDGRADGIISSIDIFVTRTNDTAFTFLYRIDEYLEPSEDDSRTAKSFPLSGVAVTKHSVWSKVLRLRNPPPREQEIQIDTLRRSIVDGNADAMQQFKKIVEDNFNAYQPGQYYVLLIIKTRDSANPVVNLYHFELKDEDIAVVRDGISRLEERLGSSKRKAPVAVPVDIFQVKERTVIRDIMSKYQMLVSK